MPAETDWEAAVMERLMEYLAPDLAAEATARIFDDLNTAHVRLLTGGTTYDMWAAFQDRGMGARRHVCGSLDAARRKAAIWRDDAYVAHCTSTVWPNGDEFRTAWEEVPGVIGQ